MGKLTLVCLKYSKTSFIRTFDYSDCIKNEKLWNNDVTKTQWGDLAVSKRKKSIFNFFKKTIICKYAVYIIM